MEAGLDRISSTMQGRSLSTEKAERSCKDRGYLKQRVARKKAFPAGQMFQTTEDVCVVNGLDLALNYCSCCRFLWSWKVSIESAKQETNDISTVPGRLVLEFAGPEYIALKYMF